jgi:hypothetical protein
MLEQMSRLNVSSCLSPLNFGSNIKQSINALTKKLESITLKSPTGSDSHNQLNNYNTQIDNDRQITDRIDNQQVDDEHFDTRMFSTIQIPNIVVLPASESQLNSFANTNHSRRKNNSSNKCQKRLSLRRWLGRSSIVTRRLLDDVVFCDQE